MNAEILRKAGIDYDNGVRRFLGKTALFEKTLLKFLNDGTFFRVRAAYSSGDTKALFDAVHELKGMCGNLSLTPLYRASCDLAALLRAGGFSPSELTVSYEILNLEYHRIYSALLSAAEDSEGK